MSSTHKKEGALKEAPQPEAPVHRAGPAPAAMVIARHGGESVTREGRGYSLGELEGAGVAAGSAARLTVRVDYRRRSVLKANVGALKDWWSHQPPAKKPESRVQKVEAEVKKVEREVKKEVVKVEKEVKKAGREVEKEAKKVEKKVKKPAAKKAKAKAKGKAKPRPKKK